MPYIQADKSKGIIESYTPDWITEINNIPFNADKIPGLNDTQINPKISVEGGSIISIIGGTNISVDNTDPTHPVINNTYTPA